MTPEPGEGPASAAPPAGVSKREPTAAERGRAPALPRRMACFLYEAMLLFGVALVPALLATLLFPGTGSEASPIAGPLIQAVAIAVYASYFVGFWSARGQTLAMQTWRIRLVDAAGETPTRARALARFVAACIGWFAPALLLTGAAHASLATKVAAIGTGIVVYAVAALAAPGRQFWHDVACRTRLVDARGETPRATVRPRPR